MRDGGGVPATERTVRTEAVVEGCEADSSWLEGWNHVACRQHSSSSNCSPLTNSSFRTQGEHGAEFDACTTHWRQIVVNRRRKLCRSLSCRLNWMNNDTVAHGAAVASTLCPATSLRMTMIVRGRDAWRSFVGVGFFVYIQSRSCSLVGQQWQGLWAARVGSEPGGWAGESKRA